MVWAEVWRRRGALLYTAGAWVVFGSIAFCASRYTGKRPEEQEEEEQEEPLPPAGSSISEDGLKETIVYSTEGRRFNVVSTTLYKPNFVPPTTRLHNYVQSFLEDSGGKGK